MASFITNRGKYSVLLWSFRAGTIPTNYYLALLDDDTTPTVDTNLMSDVTEVGAGNGYTSGGTSLTPGATDFDVITEDDTNDRGLIQLKDIVFTASGGNLPASGTGARWAALTDDNVTVSSREIYTVWDLVSNRTVSDGQALTLQDCEMRLNNS